MRPYRSKPEFNGSGLNLNLTYQVMKLSKIEQYVEELIEEKGWVTDNYVSQFGPSHFSAQEIETTKDMLAKKGVLYREGDETLKAMRNNTTPADSAKIHPSTYAEKHFNNINDLGSNNIPFRVVDGQANLVAKFYSMDAAIKYLISEDNRYLMTKYDGGKYDMWSVTNIYGGLKHEL